MNLTIQLTPEQVVQLSQSAQSLSIDSYGPELAMRLLTQAGEQDEIAAALAFYTKVSSSTEPCAYPEEVLAFVRTRDTGYSGGQRLEGYALAEKVKKEYVTLRKHMLREMSNAMRSQLDEEVKRYAGEFRDEVIVEFQSQAKDIMATFMAASFTKLFADNSYEVSQAIKKGILGK
jgi:hypothetical protein